MPSDDELPLIAQPINYPGTSFIIAICSFVCYYLNSRGLGYYDVGSSYWLVVHEGMWWRTVTASFSHLSLIHLAFNVYSTWQLRHAETKLGVLGYLSHTLLFLILSIAMQISLHAMLARTRWRDRTQNTVGIGFSCVVFAWMTWAALHSPSQKLDLVFVKLPWSTSPFVSLVVTQLMIPNVDFVGHLAGIFAGYIEGWGLVAWLQGYWLLQTAVWTCIAVIISLVRSKYYVPFVEELQLSQQEESCASKYTSSQNNTWESTTAPPLTLGPNI